VSGQDLEFLVEYSVVGGRQYPIVIVKDDAETVAQTLRARRDKIYGNIFSEAPTDMRWSGELGEMCLDAWLAVVGVPHRMLTDDHGAGKPDCFVREQSVGVKAVKRKVPIIVPRSGEIYSAQISERHVREPVQWYFFCSYEFPRRAMWLLGGLEKEVFLNRAKQHKEGDKVHENYTVRKGHEIRNLDIQHLYSAQEWVDRL